MDKQRREELKAVVHVILRDYPDLISANILSELITDMEAIENKQQITRNCLNQCLTEMQKFCCNNPHHIPYTLKEVQATMKELGI